MNKNDIKKHVFVSIFIILTLLSLFSEISIAGREFKIYETTFYGSTLRFTSSDPKKIAEWLINYGGFSQTVTYDGELFLVMPDGETIIPGGPDLDKWIREVFVKYGCPKDYYFDPKDKTCYKHIPFQQK